MRTVTTTPNRQGVIELGPCDHGFALGDTLTITPLAEALGNRAVMLLPKHMEKFAFLFNNLCPVKITENYPIFQWARGNAAAQKLAMFGFKTHSPLAKIKLSVDVIERGKKLMQGTSNPIAFVPTCSAHWEHVRQRPSTFWKPVVKHLSQRYTVCQFGRKEYPTLEGVKRMPYVDLETLAGIYHNIFNYVGVDTGDYHLMIAVGGRAVVAEPAPMPKIQADFWLYDSPRIAYGTLNHPQTIIEAIQKIGL